MALLMEHRSWRKPMCAQLSGTLPSRLFLGLIAHMGARSQWIRVTASFCYYDTETGGASWFAPEGSSPSFIYDQGDFSQPIYIGEPPPSLPVNQGKHRCASQHWVVRTGTSMPSTACCWCMDEQDTSVWALGFASETSMGACTSRTSSSTCLPTGRRLGVHCALPGLSTCATIKADPPRQPNDGRRRCTVPELHWSAAILARFVRQRPTFPIKGHYERANGTLWKKI